MKTVLFVTTEPSLSGAPLYLLNHIRILKSTGNDNYIIIFIHKRNALLEEFKKVAKVYFWEDIFSAGLNASSFKGYLCKAIKRSDIASYLSFTLFFNLYLKKANIYLIIANSATIHPKALIYLKKLTTVPVITIVHEGEKLLQKFNSDNTVKTNFENSDKIVAVSQHLRKVLTEKYNVSDKDISVITGAVTATVDTPLPEITLIDYSIPSNAKVIMSSGWLSWHKGADFFIQAAIQVLKLRSDVHFCWLGDAATPEDLEQFRYDIEKAGIQNFVHHIPTTSTPLSYFSKADIFLMLSRNESFSLVTVEACYLQKPVLCFENSGGPCEILDNDPNLVIPFGDIGILSNRIIELLENDELRAKTGKKLYDKVISNYTMEKTTLQLQQLITDVIS